MDSVEPTGQPTPDAEPREAPPAATWPAVSVIMPVLDEEPYLRDAVGAVLAQDYPGEVELVVALGPSRDRTDEIAHALAAEDPRVRLVANPSGATPSGLNAAIRASRHDIVVRVDGHGRLAPGYLARAVEVLEKTGADNVGGLMAAVGETDFERAVARAMTSPLGIGGARFHVGGGEGPASTVYLGVFRRDALERLGGYDETLRRAQDWELNYRIRQSGGLVWFSPDLRVDYRPRPNLRALARQFYLTGQWRRLVSRLHPGTASLRYLAPPAAVVGCVVGLGAGLAGLSAKLPWLTAGFAVPAVYAGGVVVGSLVVGHGLPARARLWLPVVVATMHLTWGAGFVTSPRTLAGSTGGRDAEAADATDAPL